MWVRGDALQGHPTLPALLGPLVTIVTVVTIVSVATSSKVTPVQGGGPGSAQGSPALLSCVGSCSGAHSKPLCQTPGVNMKANG